MYMIVKNSGSPIQKIFDDKKSLEEIVAIDEKVSFNVTEAIDYYEQATAAYNRVYYIYDGLMKLLINGQEIQLYKGDACFVEKGMAFELKGTFKVIVVSQPVLHL